jgi:hypothetical protein
MKENITLYLGNPDTVAATLSELDKDTFSKLRYLVVNNQELNMVYHEDLYLEHSDPRWVHWSIWQSDMGSLDGLKLNCLSIDLAMELEEKLDIHSESDMEALKSHRDNKAKRLKRQRWCIIHFRSAEMAMRYLKLVSETELGVDEKQHNGIARFQLHRITDTEEWEPNLGQESVVSVMTNSPQEPTSPLVM